MKQQATSEGQYYKKDLWGVENKKYAVPHHRLVKSARIVNRMAGPTDRTLLDAGCGPATLRTLLRPSISYYGIDIAIPTPMPNLLERDLIKDPIAFEGKLFDIVVAQGLFEYVGKHQSEKFSEIARILAPGGIFLTSYVNFDHRRPYMYSLYNNIQPIENFREDLSRHFTVQRRLPTSHNWNHSEPSRRIIKAANLLLNVTIPHVSRKLAVEYFFICSGRELAPV